MGLIQIQVRSWEKFNPRADRGNFAWFRFQNSFFTDQAIFCLSNSAKLLFVFLCCEASKHNAGEFEINVEYVAALLKNGSDQIHRDIQELASSALVEVLNGSSSVLSCENLGANGTYGTERTERNRTRRTKRTSASEPEVEIVHPVIEELKGDQEAEKYLEAIPETSQKRWVKLYGAEHVKREVLKAIAWLHDSGEKRQPGKFLGGWLSRSDKGKGQQGARKTKAEEISDYNQRMFDAIERGEV